MAKRYYLAYGSNLNMRQMIMRCESARLIGTATIENYRLVFKGSKTGAYLTIEPHEGSSVPVGVWEVTKADERNLDRYEGFPTFYYKKEMVIDITGIRTGKVRTRDAFVYIMDENRKYGMPSNSYFTTCLQGYKDFKFDSRTLFNAWVETSNLQMEAEQNENE